MHATAMLFEDADNQAVKDNDQSLPGRPSAIQNMHRINMLMQSLIEDPLEEENEGFWYTVNTQESGRQRDESASRHLAPGDPSQHAPLGTQSTPQLVAQGDPNENSRLSQQIIQAADSEEMQVQNQMENADLLPFTKSLIKQLDTPLLCTPQNAKRQKKKERKAAKADIRDTDKDTDKDTQRKSARLASKPKTRLTVEQQATALLIKKTGFLSQDEELDANAHSRFRAQFTQPLSSKTIKNYRIMFGMERTAEADYQALALEADA
uniref:Uncharacterized protein n=1 Tax=Arundo donax TaxID=35708 RepID=A0A0A9CBA9_ARUDO